MQTRLRRLCAIRRKQEAPLQFGILDEVAEGALPWIKNLAMKGIGWIQNNPLKSTAIGIGAGMLDAKRPNNISVNNNNNNDPNHGGPSFRLR